MEIRIVIDTNVYLSHLKTLEIVTRRNKDIRILLPRVVLHELDMLKIGDINARKAIKYISASKEIILEGTEDKMDVVQEVNKVIKNLEKGNNDDKILKFVFENHDSILVTKDQTLILKAKSLGIKHVDFDTNFMRLINESCLNNSIEDMEIESHNNRTCTDEIERFITETAKHYSIGGKKIDTLSFLEKLDFMIRNFQYYTRTLSNNSKDEIIKIKNELSNNINTEYNVSRLKIILGVAF